MDGYLSFVPINQFVAIFNPIGRNTICFVHRSSYYQRWISRAVGYEGIISPRVSIIMNERDRGRDIRRGYEWFNKRMNEEERGYRYREREGI